MQNAKPEPLHSASRLKIDLTDISGSPALSRRVRDLASSLDLELVDLAGLPKLSIVAIDVEQGFSLEARQAISLARTAGTRDIIFLMATSNASDPDLCTTTAAAFDDFAGKLEFDSAVALAIGSDEAAPSSDAGLKMHLMSRATDQRSDEAITEPGPLSEQFSAHIGCISDQQLLPGRDYRLRLAGHEMTASVTSVKYRLDIDSLRRAPARALGRGEIGVCTIATTEPLSLGDSPNLEDAARFTLSDIFTGEVVAVGSVDFALRRGMNVHWQPFTVTKDLRAAIKDQRACIVWFTGLSGAGKSTIANLVEGWLALQGRHTYLLDGDNVRHGLNKDLGFTAADRVENIRRVGEVARLFVDAGLVVLCSFISPFRAEREAVRSLVEPNEFIEIHVTAPLNVCEHRDPKGLYAKSRAGLLPNFTGIDSPYEAPDHPDLVLDTTSAPAAELAQRVVELLQSRGVVTAPEEYPALARGF